MVGNTVPIQPEQPEYVTYGVNERGASDVVVPVEEIALIQDPALIAALERRLQDLVEGNSHLHFPYAFPDGSFSHTMRVSRTPLILPRRGE